MRMEPNSLSDEQKKNPRYIMNKAGNRNQHIGRLLTPCSVQLVARIINLDV